MKKSFSPTRHHKTEGINIYEKNEERRPPESMSGHKTVMQNPAGWKDTDLCLWFMMDINVLIVETVKWISVITLC